MANIPATQHPYITQDTKVSRGSAVIRGTRVRIVDIIIEYEYLGKSPDAIIEAHPQLNLSSVHDALSYYYENRESVDREIQERKSRIAELENHYKADVSE